MCKSEWAFLNYDEIVVNIEGRPFDVWEMEWERAIYWKCKKRYDKTIDTELNWFRFATIQRNEPGNLS